MKKTFIALAAVSAALLSGMAQAEGLNMDKFSVRGQIGQTVNDADGASTHKTSGGVFAGYQYNKNLGAEVGYTTLGTEDFVGVSAKFKAVPVRAVYTHDLGQGVALNGKLGVAHVKASVSDGTTASSTRETYGIGATYAVSQNVDVTVDYDRYKLRDGDARVNLDQFGVGVKYKF